MKRYQKSAPYSYTLGVFPTLELLQTRADCVRHVLISSRGQPNQGVAQIKTLCAQRHIPLEVADAAIERLAGCENCYVVGCFTKYTCALQPGNHLVLVQPSDAGNLGTILRTALAYNLTNLAIIRPAVDIFEPKVIRASMGALFHLNFAYFDSFAAYRASASAGGQHLYPFMTDGVTPLPAAHFEPPFALIFGSEGTGLDAAYRDVGASVRIPQTAAVDSLNVAVAVGIALYASRPRPDSAFADRFTMGL